MFTQMWGSLKGTYTETTRSYMLRHVHIANSERQFLDGQA